MHNRANQSSFAIYKRQQARISRRRLYPITLFYGLYSAIVVILVYRSPHSKLGILFFLLGIAVWTLVEYLFHECDLSIDLLVNNAGFGLRGEFWKLSLDHQLEMLRLHHAGLVELMFHLLPSMIAERRGGIINVSSTAAFQPIPYVAAYAACKAFVTSFSLALAEELRPYGVTVVTVCPGRLRPDSPIDNGAKPRRALMGVAQSREQVVTEALKALDSHGGLVIPGVINKSVAFAERLIPRSVIAKLVARLSRPAPAS